MGISMGSKSSSSFEPTPAIRQPGNPNPNNWKFIKGADYSGGYVIIELEYPDCRNYEGRKILVFEATSLKKLVKQKTIDPHFFTQGKLKSPIARFIPTIDGWAMAEALVDALAPNEEKEL